MSTCEEREGAMQGEGRLSEPLVEELQATRRARTASTNLTDADDGSVYVAEAFRRGTPRKAFWRCACAAVHG